MNIYPHQHDSFNSTPFSLLKRCGFTLIEVLVVVAIIALLVAILIPTLSRARDQARSAKCLANVRSMGAAVNTFASSHKGYFQITTGEAGRQLADPESKIFAYESGSGEPTLLSWPAAILREQAQKIKRNDQWGIAHNALQSDPNLVDAIPTFDTLICPSDEFPFAAIQYPQNQAGFCYFSRLSYGYNFDITGVRTNQNTKGVWKDGNPSNSQGAGDNLRGRLDKVIRPSEVMLFADAGSMASVKLQLHKPSSHAVGLSTSGPSAAHCPRGPLLEYVDASYLNKLKPNRHGRQIASNQYELDKGKPLLVGGRINVCFADGHGATTTKRGGNPFFSQYGGSMDLLPNWQFLPKVRVSPYNSGIYPKEP
ncbi:MAG: DUF1559 family PulG-like putative transporter [Planctomycetota bacterium]|jgi:prepilin-type N-terminal cleavage/methylation domain-containing protein/prepilin-type processing-associated H-X9-DG protein